MKRLTVTIEEAASALGIGRNSAYAAARTGQIPTIRVGKRLLVSRAALEKLLGAQGNDVDATKKGTARR